MKNSVGTDSVKTIGQPNVTSVTLNKMQVRVAAGCDCQHIGRGVQPGYLCACVRDSPGQGAVPAAEVQNVLACLRFQQAE